MSYGSTLKVQKMLVGLRRSCLAFSVLHVDLALSLQRFKTTRRSFCVKLHNSSQFEVCNVLSPCNLSPGPGPRIMCTPRRFGYETRFLQQMHGNATLPEISIDSLLMRSLIIHPVVSIFALASLACLIARRPSVLLTYATLFVQFTAFVTDLVVYRHVAGLLRALERVGLHMTVRTGAALWLSFIILLLLFGECVLMAKGCRDAQVGELPTMAATPDAHAEAHVLQRFSSSPRILPVTSTSGVLSGEGRGKAGQSEAQLCQECPLCLEHPQRREPTVGKVESIPDSGCAQAGARKRAWLPCGHAFCYDCIAKALKVNSSCPLCRRPSSKRDLKAIS